MKNPDMCQSFVVHFCGPKIDDLGDFGGSRATSHAAAMDLRSDSDAIPSQIVGERAIIWDV